MVRFSLYSSASNAPSQRELKCPLGKEAKQEAYRSLQASIILEWSQSGKH